MLSMIKRSIFHRLLLSYLVTVLLGLGAVGILLTILTKDYIYDSKQEELVRQAKKVNLSIHNIPVIQEDSKQMLMFLGQSFDTKIWVFDRNGKIIATSMQDEVFVGKSVAPSVVEKVLKGENALKNLKFEGLEEPTISAAVTWGKEDNVYGGIVLHAPIAGLNDTISNIRESIIWATLFGVLFSTAMVYYTSWSISRPLRKIDLVASKIGEGDYSERIQIDSADEIGDLANTINSMADKMEEVNEERKKLDMFRTEFLSNISHELRTPLTAMQGFLEALQDGLIPIEGRTKYYDVMYQETIHMNRLVEDISDLIKLQNKDITISKFPVDVGAILHKAAFVYSQEAEEKGLEIQVHVEDHLAQALGDRYRLEQIVTNLIKNAIKFTEKGAISVTAEEDGSYILIRISDTGMGIAEEDQELVWERFFKVDRGRSKNNKGTGLGLAIVKELVELHQGRITMQSAVAQGTTFNIWIPSVAMIPANQSTE